MDIALIRRQFSATGGAEQYMQRLLGALVRAGHQVHLYAEAWEGVPPGASLHTVPVRGTRAERPRRFATAVKEQLAGAGHDCVFSLERTLKQEVYRAGDGVHRVWLARRREFAPWWRKPFVGLGGFHRTMQELEAETFSPANTGRIIVNSEMVKREILRHFEFPEDRIHLVRNGVDTARFQSGQRAETRARFGLKEDDYVLLFVGSGWERKGLPVLLRAMKQWEYPGSTSTGGRLKLLVVGKGKPPGNTGSNVIFAGPMERVEDAYAAADLFVFLPIYEPSANVVFEALAAGLPVITSAQNGAGEVIKHGQTGLVLDAPADLGAVMRAVMEWKGEHRGRLTQVDTAALDLQRNVNETLAILELAAKEKAA